MSNCETNPEVRDIRTSQYKLTEGRSALTVQFTGIFFTPAKNTSRVIKYYCLAIVFPVPQFFTNVVVWPSTTEKQRQVLLQSRLMEVPGTVQKESGVLHLIAKQLDDLSPSLQGKAMHPMTTE